eukprot:m.57990 g.57990  ORF g.57990 m.57990 type:complete len:64 (+) comp15635_c0_seq2:90-281(+)
MVCTSTTKQVMYAPKSISSACLASAVSYHTIKHRDDSSETDCNTAVCPCSARTLQMFGDLRSP